IQPRKECPNAGGSIVRSTRRTTMEHIKPTFSRWRPRPEQVYVRRRRFSSRKPSAKRPRPNRQACHQPPIGGSASKLAFLACFGVAAQALLTFFRLRLSNLSV